MSEEKIDWAKRFKSLESPDTEKIESSNIDWGKRFGTKPNYLKRLYEIDYKISELEEYGKQNKDKWDNESKKNTYSGSMGMFAQPSQFVAAAMPKEQKDWSAALAELRQARKNLNTYTEQDDKEDTATGKERNGWSTMIDGLTNQTVEDVADLFTFGLTTIANDAKISSALAKASKGETLSEVEQMMVDSYKLNRDAQQYVADRGGATTGYTIGSSLPQSVQFMIETVGTGGSLGVVKAGMKQGIKGLAKGIGTAAYREALRTPLRGSMYGKVAETEKFQYGVEEDGEVTLDNPVSFAENLWDSYASTFAEGFSEQVGRFMPDKWVGNIAQKALKPLSTTLTKIPPKIIGAKASAAIGGGIEKVGDAMFSVRKNLSDVANFNGTVNEYVEEQVSMIIEPLLTGEPERIKDMFNTKTQLATLGSVTLFGSAMNTVSALTGGINSSINLHNMRQNTNSQIASIKDEELRQGVYDALKRNNTIEQMVDGLSSVTDWSKADPADIRSTVGAYISKIEYDVHRGSFEENRVESLADNELMRFKKLFDITKNQDTGLVHELVDDAGNKYYQQHKDNEADDVMTVRNSTGTLEQKSKNELKPAREPFSYEDGAREILMQLSQKVEQESARAEREEAVDNAESSKVTQQDYSMDDEVIIDGGKTARFVKYNQDGTKTAVVEFTDEETGDKNTEIIRKVDILGKVKNLQDLQSIENSETSELKPSENQPVADSQPLQNQEVQSQISFDEFSKDAIIIPEIELNEENWEKIFGNDNTIQTPTGIVKMGENQMRKLLLNKRDEQFGMVVETLQNPTAIVKDSKSEQDNPAYVYMKSFINPKNKLRFYSNIAIDKDGSIVSSHYLSEEQAQENIEKWELLYRTTRLDTPDQAPIEQTPIVNNVGTINDNKDTSIPLQKDGEPDYNAMSASMFMEEFGKRFSPEEAREELANELKEYQKRIKSIKSSTTTDRNKKIANREKVKELESRISDLQSVLNPEQIQQQITEVNIPVVEEPKQFQPSYEVGEQIKVRYEQAPKEYGFESERNVPGSDETISGRFVLTESGAVTPSHDSQNFANSDGFPVDENGSTVNDRDYSKDTEAQKQVIQIASNYDGRALDTPVIVSKDGVVISGNNRTMSGELAAKSGTDKAYIERLRNNASQYGFTQEQIANYSHPRIVFETSETPKYNTETFAKFNAQDTKTQNKVERAVKAGKIIKPQSVRHIADIIDKHETLGEFYSDRKSIAETLKTLQNDAIINANEVAELKDGENLSAIGKDMIETLLVGSVVDEDAVRLMNSDGMRKYRNRITKAILPIVENSTLGKFSIADVLNESVAILDKARQQGGTIDDATLQLDAFDRVEYSAPAISMAKALEGSSDNALRNLFTEYNKEASFAASGQTDLLSGSVRSKDEIMQALGLIPQQKSEQNEQPKPVSIETPQPTIELSKPATSITDAIAESETQEERHKAVSEFITRMNETTRANVSTFTDIKELPEELQAQILSDPSNIDENGNLINDIDGFTFGGAIYISSPLMNDTKRAERTYIHEVVGHQFIDKLIKKNQREMLFDAVVDDIGIEHMRSHNIDELNQEIDYYQEGIISKRKLGREYIAYLSEQYFTPKDFNIKRNEIFVDLSNPITDNIIGEILKATNNGTGKIGIIPSRTGQSKRVRTLDILDKQNRGRAIRPSIYSNPTPSDSNSLGTQQINEGRLGRDGSTAGSSKNNTESLSEQEQGRTNHNQQGVVSEGTIQPRGLALEATGDRQRTVNEVSRDGVDEGILLQGESANVGSDRELPRRGLSDMESTGAGSRTGSVHGLRGVSKDSSYGTELLRDDETSFLANERELQNDNSGVDKYEQENSSESSANHGIGRANDATTEPRNTNNGNRRGQVESERADTAHDRGMSNSDGSVDTNMVIDQPMGRISDSVAEREFTGISQSNNGQGLQYDGGTSRVRNERNGSRDRGSSNDELDGRGVRLERPDQVRHLGTNEDGDSLLNRESRRRNERNFRIEDPSQSIVPNGDISKIKVNIEAVKLLKQLQSENRDANGTEKSILSQYSGWGGLSTVLDRNRTIGSAWDVKYKKYHDELRDILTPEEFTAAVNSTINAHYTTPQIISDIWGAVERMGFTGGTIMEPAVGSGNFFGAMPTAISDNSKLVGYELDPMTGGIAQKLYPDADIRVAGYETAKEGANSVDLVISNVPFGQTAPYDSKHKDISKFSLHNYFIAKGIRQLRDGGLGVFITSSSTMDGGKSREFRQWVERDGNADFIGAMRLPNTAFSNNAGTQVTTDVLFFRKRNGRQKSNQAQSFEKLSTIREVTKEVYDKLKRENVKKSIPLQINEYFAQNPEMMLGDMHFVFEVGNGGLYSDIDQTLQPRKGEDLSVKLREAVNKLPQNIFVTKSTIDDTINITEASEDDIVSTFIKRNGVAYEVTEDGLLPFEGNIKIGNNECAKSQIVSDFIDIKDTARKLVELEQNSNNDKEIEKVRRQLNKIYDKFVKNYGTLNDNTKINFLEDDIQHVIAYAIEKVDPYYVKSKTGKDIRKYNVSKADILNRRINIPIELPQKANSISDAISLSIRYKGSINTPFIAQLLNTDEDLALIEMLESGEAFINPQTGRAEQRTEYLSGYVKDKLEIAKEYVKTDSQYEKNIAELQKVIPADIAPSDVNFRLGSYWIPSEYVSRFYNDQFGFSPKIIYSEPLNEWIVSNGWSNKDTVVQGYRSSELANKVLNQQQVVVYDKVGDRRVRNVEATAEVATLMAEINDAFIDFISNDSNMIGELAKIYNHKFNNYVKRTYDTDSGYYPGANRDIKLRPHQSNAVQRILNDSVLLAHEVGTGKTFTMITGAMEMRRLGIARKPMIVVQNSTLQQFATSFQQLYPSAKLLVPSEKQRSAEQRQRLFAMIAYGDFDSVIVPQSFIDFIEDDSQRVSNKLQQELDAINDMEADITDYSMRKELNKRAKELEKSIEKASTPTVKDIAKKQLSTEKKFKRKADRRTDKVFTFEQLGVDALFVDEAHAYKKLGFTTNMGNVKGIDTGVSKRAFSMKMKTDWIQERTGGRNVVFATGTPITNTMAEAWTMMRYIAPDVLKRYGIENFDAFASTFGVVESSFEFNAAGNFKQVERFKSFMNAPEFISIFKNKTDVVLSKDIPDFEEKLPKLLDGGFTQVITKRSQQLINFMDTIKRELTEWVKQSPKERNKAVPLVMFARASQAAIDMRLVNPNAIDDPDSKANAVIRNVKRIYDKTASYNGTQMIFADRYMSPDYSEVLNNYSIYRNPDTTERFNLYEDMRNKLIDMGVHADEIAIVSDMDAKKKEQLFDKVNSGEVRIVLGSTEKMGVGVNAQRLLAAVHHVDAPARPMDFTQRNGRIIRQGNTHVEIGLPVEILTYGVEKTLDVTAYQRLTIKQKFIEQVLSGEIDSRVIEDAADEVSVSGNSFEEMMSNLSGSQYALRLTDLNGQLRKAEMQSRNYERSRGDLKYQLSGMSQRIIPLKRAIEKSNHATDVATVLFPNQKITKLNIGGKHYTEKIGEVIQNHLTEYSKQYIKNRNTDPIRFTVNNNPTSVVVMYDSFNEKFSYITKIGDVEIKGEMTSGPGFVTSLTSRVKNIYGDTAKYEAELRDIEKAVPALEKRLNEPNKSSDKIIELRSEIEAVTKLIAQESEAEEKRIADELAKQLDNNDSDVRYRNVGSDDFTQEMSRIKSEVIKRGDYMMAPNGEPSNLNERQWLQVRTKEFKEWFGDWEKATRIEKLRNSSTVEITGDEYLDKYELNRDSAKKYLKDELRGNYTIKDTNEIILLAKDGAQKVTSHSMGNESHLKSIAVIPSLIENAIFITELGNSKSNNKYDSYRYYGVGLKIDGVDYTVKMTVGVDTNGNKYYDHSLTEIEKGKLIDKVGALSTTLPLNDKVALSEYKDNKLLEILQNSLSKTTDANGEPNISEIDEFEVDNIRYHDTHTLRDSVSEAERFHKWEQQQQNTYKSKDKRHTEVRNVLQKLADKFKTQVVIVDSKSELPYELRYRNNTFAGAYQKSTGKVYFVLNNLSDIVEAQRTFLHEVVAHKGIDGLMGAQNAAKFYEAVFDSLDSDTQTQLLKKHKTNSKVIAGDEMVAAMAEGDVTPGVMQRIVSAIRKFFREVLGMPLRISKNDIRYILWKSKNNLQRANNLSEVFKVLEEEKHLKANLYPKEKTLLDKIKDVAARYRETKTPQEINSNFNRELGMLRIGNLSLAHEFFLGMPSEALLASGMPNLPIELSVERLLRKLNQSNHPFDLSNVENLPKAIANPIAVFDSKTQKGSKVLLTELSNGMKNFVVAIKTGVDSNSNIQILEVNSVRSLYPKNTQQILGWIANDGLLQWVDKKKALDFLSTQWPNYIASGESSKSQGVTAELWTRKSGIQSGNFKGDINADLSSATKVVENFENPISDFRFREISEVDKTDNQSKKVKKSESYIDKKLRKFQDRTLPVKTFIKKLTGSSDNVESFYNLHSRMNREQAIIRAAQDKYDQVLFNPMMTVVKTIGQEHNLTLNDIEAYCFAKSAKENYEENGVLGFIPNRDKSFVNITTLCQAKQDYPEKNRKFLIKIVNDLKLKKDENYNKEQINDIANRLYDNIRNSDTEEWNKEQLEDLAKKIQKSLIKSFDGNWTEDYVNEVIERTETALGERGIDALWDSIRPATKFGIDEEVRGGLYTQLEADAILNSRHYYFPLRGIDLEFEEKVDPKAMYDYITKSGYGSRFDSALKHAKGRMSKPANGFAYIQQIAHLEVIRAEDNITKRVMHRLVEKYSERKDLARSIITYYRRGADGIFHETLEKPSEEEIELSKKARVDERNFNAELGRIHRNKKIDKQQKILLIADIQDKIEDARNRQTIRHYASEARNYIEIESDDIETHYRGLSMSQEKEHLVEYYIHGRKHYMLFQDASVARAINGIIPQWIQGTLDNPIFKTLSKMQRLRANLITSLNPEFGVKNGIRDWRGAFIHILADNKLKYWLMIQKASSGAAIRDAKNKLNPLTEEEIEKSSVGIGDEKAFTILKNRYGEKRIIDTYYSYWVASGGKTGFSSSIEISKRNERIKKLFLNGKIKNGTIHKRDFFDGIKTVLSFLSEWSENNVRFSSFMAQMMAGSDLYTAVDFGKNVSVNFDTKGEVAQLGNAWSLFFNARVQSIMNNIELSKKHPIKVGLYYLFVIAVNGYLESALSDLIQGDDDDDGNIFSDFWRSTVTSFFEIGDYGIGIPVSHIERPLKAIGNAIYDYTHERKSGGEAIFNIWGTIANAWSPIEIANGINPMNLYPDIIRPFADVWHNVGWDGNSINHVPFLSNQESSTPDSSRGKNAGSLSTMLSKSLNKLAGGNNYVPAGYDKNGSVNHILNFLDISPSSIEYIVKAYTGFLGSLILDINQIVDKKTDGKNVDFRNIPFIKSFIAKPYNNNAKIYYENRAIFSNLKYWYDNNMKNDSFVESWATTPKEFEEQRRKLDPIFKKHKKIEKQLKHLRDKRDQYNYGSLEYKHCEDDMNELFIEFNKYIKSYNNEKR